MVNELLKQKMIDVSETPTSISRKANLNIATVRKALSGDAKLSVYIAIARALNSTLKITVE